jgi:hypothetical protein
MSKSLDYGGDLTIRAVSDSREALLSALADSPAVTVSVAEDATVDLTFVQLIEAGRRTALEDGRTLTLARPAAGSLHEVLRRGGFLETARRREFWLLETEGR